MLVDLVTQLGRTTRDAYAFAPRRIFASASLCHFAFYVRVPEFVHRRNEHGGAWIFMEIQGEYQGRAPAGSPTRGGALSALTGSLLSLIGGRF